MLVLPWKRGLVVALGSLALAGCSLFSSSDKRLEPAPLVDIQATATAHVDWSVNVGRSSGLGFSPTVVGTSVYAAATDGNVVKVNLTSGQVEWQVRLDDRLQAGTGSDGQVTAVVTDKGVVVALDDSGTELWRASASSEVTIPPVVGEGLVVVRSGDYRVQAFDARTGDRRWSAQRPGPALALRAFNDMVIAGGFVITGLPGGKLVAISIDNGVIQWEGTVAMPRGASELERVADVVGRPELMNNLLCAVAFQGRIACFDIAGGGEMVWARDFSGVSGLGLDNSTAFASDSNGVMAAFLLSGGTQLWRQDALRNRRLSAPASDGRVLLVGDYQGYLHILAREDGRLLGRQATSGSAIVAPLQATPFGFVVQDSGGGLRLVSVSR